MTSRTKKTIFYSIGGLALLIVVGIWVLLTYYINDIINDTVVPRLEESVRSSTNGDYLLTLGKVNYDDGTLFCPNFNLERINYDSAASGLNIRRVTIDTVLFVGVNWWDLLWGRGVIANVSSITARLPAFPAYGFYAAGKYAINALSESLSAEVAPFGIRVLSIEPGYFDTELVATIDSLLGQVHDASPYAEVNRFMLNFSKNALATGGNPADVGSAIVAAVSDPASALHVTVGADTGVFLDVWKNTGTFESFSAAMAEILGAQA